VDRRAAGLSLSASVTSCRRASSGPITRRLHEAVGIRVKIAQVDRHRRSARFRSSSSEPTSSKPILMEVDMRSLLPRGAVPLSLLLTACVAGCSDPGSSDLDPEGVDGASTAGGAASATWASSHDASPGARLEIPGMAGISARIDPAGPPDTAVRGDDVSSSAPELSTDGPISAPLETWTWVSFPDAVCADGSPTGIGVNLTDRSDRVLIFFEGGGGCWDYVTCYEMGMAVNLDGYDEKDFTVRKPYQNLPLFDRTYSENPLADASYVYIPYCTGDVHSGNKVSDLGTGRSAKTTYFVGSKNVAAYLNRLVPTFSNASRVWLSGWSAGGFGAAFNWEQAQQAFGDIRVNVIDDSGPPIDPGMDRWNTWLAAWNIQLPPACADCATGPTALINYYGQRYDGTHRFALLSYTEDSTISTYFAISRRKFHAELYDVADNYFDPLTSVKYFFLEGSSHTLLGSNKVSADGIQLYDWLDEMVNDDTGWRSTRP
jgi:hypothetical protein